MREPAATPARKRLVAALIMADLFLCIIAVLFTLLLINQVTPIFQTRLPAPATATHTLAAPQVSAPETKSNTTVPLPESDLLPTRSVTTTQVVRTTPATTMTLPPGEGMPGTIYLPLILTSRPITSSEERTASLQADWVESAMAEMSLEQKIGQMIITGVKGYEISSTSCSHVQAISPAGVTFQWDNVEGPAQMREFIAELRACAGETQDIPLFFTVAHEGEYVYRFDEQVTKFPAALALGATDDPSLAYQIAYAAGQELAACGLNMVLAPVADVLVEPDNEVVSQRTFGGDAQKVADFIEQMVLGYKDTGILPVLKHFPGHGGVKEDSHKVLPVDRADWASLEANYFPPFQRGIQAGAPVVMLSHIAYPTITGNALPATVSPAIPHLLRNELGFEGVILSDSLNMKAMTGESYSVAQASLEAAKAGVDLLLLNEPAEARASYNLMLSAAKNGSLPIERIEDAVRRVLGLKAAAGLHMPALLSQTEPDWEANYALSVQAGYRAVTEYRDASGLIPIPGDIKQVLVIGPKSDEFSFYSEKLEPALRQAGLEATFRHFTIPAKFSVPETGLLKTLPAEAADYELVLVFTFQAHLNSLTKGDHFQERLVNGLINTGIPLIVVALKSPTDILEFPQVQTYLATFGTTEGAQRALVDILLGQAVAEGANPLPRLP